MAVKTIDLLHHLNQLLKPEEFEDFCPNGVQIEGASEIKKIAFAVSATQDSIKKAIDSGAQALVVHHGVFWKHQGVRPLTGAFGERIRLCIQNNLNLIAYHLPLDAHAEFGNAVSLAHELEMKNLQAFALYKRQPMGTKGELLIPLKAKELEEKLQKILNHPIILASPDENQFIKSIGIITGGANNEWVKAKEENLDAYITGEISEYNWHDAKEAGIHYFAAGHHATERCGTLALMKKVKNDFSQLETVFFDSDNPA